MTVKRVVPDLHYAKPEEAKAFYKDILGLEVVMDQGWMITFASSETTRPQISVMTEGGSGTPVPDMSIEVENVDAVHKRAQEHGFDILYPLTDEPWNVRRFFVRDPAGKIVNVLSHI